jgi:cold shock CspA family protein
MVAMVRGRINYINSSRTCGFISSDGVEKDVLFIKDADGSNLEIGLEVEFEIVQSRGGPRAKRLQRV